MPFAWRIVKKKHAAAAFTGEGAAKAGGRWNSKGVPMVYCGGTRSLTLLETLVHLNPPIYFEYVIFGAEFASELAEQVHPADLPPQWRSHPPSPATQDLGDQWVKSGRSAVLAVPSAIVPEECNYVLNPAHPDFALIRFGGPEFFSFDPRLLA